MESESSGWRNDKPETEREKMNAYVFGSLALLFSALLVLVVKYWLMTNLLQAELDVALCKLKAFEMRVPTWTCDPPVTNPPERINKNKPPKS